MADPPLSDEQAAAYADAALSDHHDASDTEMPERSKRSVEKRKSIRFAEIIPEDGDDGECGGTRTCGGLEHPGHPTA